MVIVKDKFYYNARAVISVYVGALIISYLYVAFTGEYNGDISLQEVEIEQKTLFFMFCLSILPFIFIWKRYTFYKRKTYKGKTYYINVNTVGTVLFGILLFRSILSLLDIGVMGQTTNLSWLKTISTALNPTLIMCIYIMEAKKKSNICLLSSLFIFESIVRHSLGGLFLLGMMFLLKNYTKVASCLRKHILLTLICCMVLPNLVAVGYSVRDSLRNDTEFEYNSDTAADLLCRRLAGRLSSYSNSTYILENSIDFYIHMISVPAIFYQSLILDQFGIHLASWNGTSTLEQYLFERTRGGERPEGDLTTFMVGTPGVLILSFMKSPWVFIINLITMVVLVNLYFYYANQLRITYASELALFFLLPPILSGVCTELFFPIFQFIELFIFFFIIKILPKKKQSLYKGNNYV